MADRLYNGLQTLFTRHGVEARVQGLGARFGIYFGVTEEVRDYRDAVRHLFENRRVVTVRDVRRDLDALRTRDVDSVV